MAVAATFTVVQGPVAGIGWMFREKTYGSVRKLDPRLEAAAQVLFMF